MLIHGTYLMGVFWAVAHGLPTAISVLVEGLQSLLIGAFARPLLSETVGRARVFGIVIGAVSVAVTLAPKLGVNGPGGIPMIPLTACMLGVLFITFGTIWLKGKPHHADLLSHTTVQYAGALVPWCLVPWGCR